MAGKADTVRQGAAVAQAKKAEPKQQAQPKQEQQQYDSRDYIEPRGKHPDAAVYVARDKKSGAEVSFDVWGRKLDSNGNVVHGDRQRAGDAGARIAVKPQQQAPEQKQYTDGGYGSKLTNMLSPGRAQQPAVEPQRSTWDNSIIPNQGPRMGNNPNTLAPGGVDNSFLGLPYPTARNGLVGSQWAKPWTGPQQQQQAPMSVAPQQAAGPSYNPLPTNSWRPGAEQFMAGNNQYSPVQPKVNIPGFGQLPAADPVGPQNFNRNLDVSAYMPGGAQYGRPAYQPQDMPIPLNSQFDPYRP